jgi:uncharacterized protein (TIGR03000 family)
MNPVVSLLSVALLASTMLAQVDGRGARNPPRPLQYPWQRPGYSGYAGNELWYATPRSERAAPAKKYQLFVTALSAKNTEDDPNSALLVAHLPDNARIWVEGMLVQQEGHPRHIVSPPLAPGKEYQYTVRVEWYEDGNWVGQDHQFPVHAGDVHCIDIIPSNSLSVDEEVKKNLAGLQPADRKLAEEQRFCAVQGGIRLGSMGVPVKVVLKGQTVFLCCEACVKKAQSDPDLTLERVKKSNTRRAQQPPP